MSERHLGGDPFVAAESAAESHRHSPADPLPITPSLTPLLESARIAGAPGKLRARSVVLALLALAVGVAAALIARALVALIALIGNLAFAGRLSLAAAQQAHNALGPWVVALPVAGALVIGLMARYGSAAIRGHGIPEAIEQILTNRSRIGARVLWLKPLSAAVSIGTGGPFGAEGPIIATGGALGSLLGQYVRVTADERKALLAAGAAAGMTATFGTPLAAVLLAIELLLFEFSAETLLPVLVASVAAAVVRVALLGFTPFFAMPPLAWPGVGALLACVPLGAVVGVAAVAITRAVYAVEDAFERLPLHWMWWPAIGALAVGVIGWWQPRTLGVGYDNITDALAGGGLGDALWLLGAAKLLSWTVALGSGTSGGTLAPLMTVGACLGATLGHALALAFPQLGLSPGLAALVGMAAIFAGASRALFMSVVFALESTWQLPGLLPLLLGCGTAWLVSGLSMRQTIMTEKIARRGVRVPSAYQADPFAQARVADFASSRPVALAADDRVARVRAWLDTDAPGSRHQGYPVVDDAGRVLGVLTRKDLYANGADGGAALRELLRRPATCVSADASLDDARHMMAALDIGRLPVLAADGSGALVGMLTRSDLLSAWRERLRERYEAEPASTSRSSSTAGIGLANR